MSRQESFEKHWADMHDLPVETLAQYRWAEKDGYRLPGIAAAYRNYCAGWDEALSDKIKTMNINDLFKSCIVCGKSGGHGGLGCPRMMLVGTIPTFSSTAYQYVKNESAEVKP